MYVPNLTPFASILSYTGIYMCGSGSVLGIRIQKAPECGSNTDPQHWLNAFFSIGTGAEKNPAAS